MQRLAHLVTRRPRRVLGIGLLFVILAAVVGGPLPGVLKAGDDFDDPGSQSAAARTAIEHATGTSAWPDVVALVPTPAGATAPESKAAVADAAARGSPPSPASRRSSPPRRAAARWSPATARRRWWPPSSPPTPTRTRSSPTRRTRSPAPPSRSAAATVTQEQISSQVQEDLLRAELIAMPLLLVLSLWIFRSPIAALLPVLVGGSTVMGTFFVLRLIDARRDRALGLRAQPRDGPRARPRGRLQPAARLPLPRGARPRPRTPRRRGAAMLTSAGRTVVFSSLTVSAAMLALVVFPQRFLQSMGIAGAIVPLVAASISLTLLAAGWRCSAPASTP